MRFVQSTVNIVITNHETRFPALVTGVKDIRCKDC